MRITWDELSKEDWYQIFDKMLNGPMLFMEAAKEVTLVDDLDEVLDAPAWAEALEGVFGSTVAGWARGLSD